MDAVGTGRRMEMDGKRTAMVTGGAAIRPASTPDGDRACPAGSRS
jgi:hypothetical protein